MPFYVWWLIPLVATLAAIAVLSWRSRDRPIDPHDSVAERLRFEQAMRQPSAAGRSRSAPARTDDVTGQPGDDPHGDANGDPAGRGGRGA